MSTDTFDTKPVVSQKPEIGLQISKIWEEDQPIACWKTNDGKGWFAKILFYPEKKLWYPITNPGYRSRGLLVFLSSKIENQEDFIEITGHGKNCVFADVMYY